MSTTRPSIQLGVVLLAAAAALAVLVHLHPEKLRAPAWVAFAAAALLAFGGLSTVALALGLQQVNRWLTCVLLAGMTLVPGWIAFGAGSRQCTVASVGGRSAGSEAVCRGAFGFGAVVLALMFVSALRGALRARPAT